MHDEAVTLIDDQILQLTGMHVCILLVFFILMTLGGLFVFHSSTRRLLLFSYFLRAHESKSYFLLAGGLSV